MVERKKIKKDKLKNLWKWNKRKLVDWRENFRWNKHTPFLASPIFIGQAQGGRDKHIKGGSQDGLGLLLWGQSAFTPQGCTFLACQIKLWTVTELWHWPAVSNLCCGRQNWGNYTLPQHIFNYNLIAVCKKYKKIFFKNLVI